MYAQITGDLSLFIHNHSLATLGELPRLHAPRLFRRPRPRLAEFLTLHTHRVVPSGSLSYLHTRSSLLERLSIFQRFFNMLAQLLASFNTESRHLVGVRPRCSHREADRTRRWRLVRWVGRGYYRRPPSAKRSGHWDAGCEFCTWTLFLSSLWC